DSKYLKDVSSSLEENYDEFILHVEQETLLQHGLTTGQIVMMLNPNRTTEVLTTVQKDGKDLDVIIKRDVKLPTSIDDLLNQQVPSATGTPVKISDIVDVEKGSVSNTLSRSKGQYYAT